MLSLAYGGNVRIIGMGPVKGVGGHALLKDHPLVALLHFQRWWQYPWIDCWLPKPELILLLAITNAAANRHSLKRGFQFVAVCGTLDGNLGQQTREEGLKRLVRCFDNRTAKENNLSYLYQVRRIVSC